MSYFADTVIVIKKENNVISKIMDKNLYTFYIPNDDK